MAKDFENFGSDNVSTIIKKHRIKGIYKRIGWGQRYLGFVGLGYIICDGEYCIKY